MLATLNVVTAFTLLTPSLYHELWVELEILGGGFAFLSVLAIDDSAAP